MTGRERPQSQRPDLAIARHRDAVALALAGITHAQHPEAPVSRRAQEAVRAVEAYFQPNQDTR